MKIKKFITAWCAVSALAMSHFALADNDNAETASTNTTNPSVQQNSTTNTEITSTEMNTGANPSTAFTSDQVQSIQKIVENYLINNPEILVKVSQKLQAEMQKKQQDMAEKAIGENKQTLFHDPASPVVGNANGDVTLVEFFDYQCGHCKSMRNTIEQLMQKNKNLKIVFKEWPIFGGLSKDAALAALAAHQQSKYLPFHSALLGHKGPLSENEIIKIAKTVGIDVPALKKNMKSVANQEKIKANFELAGKLGLMGTPALIIANKDETKFKFIPGEASLENLQKAIDSMK